MYPKSWRTTSSARAARMTAFNDIRELLPNNDRAEPLMAVTTLRRLRLCTTPLARKRTVHWSEDLHEHTSMLAALAHPRTFAQFVQIAQS